MSASSHALDVSILRGVTQWSRRACAAEQTVISGSARPACVLSTAPESVAANLWADARRTYFCQEVHKASEMWGDYEQKVYCILACYAEVTSIFYIFFCLMVNSIATRKVTSTPNMTATSLPINVFVPVLYFYCIFTAFSTHFLCFFNYEYEVLPAEQWLNFSAFFSCTLYKMFWILPEYPAFTNVFSEQFLNKFDFFYISLLN